MSKDTEFGGLLDIVGELKDEVVTLREQLASTREQVALLTEALTEQAPEAICCNVEAPSFSTEKAA